MRLFDFGVAPESAAHTPGEGAGVPVAAGRDARLCEPGDAGGRGRRSRATTSSASACVIHEMVSGRHPYGRRGVDRARDAAVVPERLASLGPDRASAVASALALSARGSPDDGRTRPRPAGGRAPASPHRRRTGCPRQSRQRAVSCRHRRPWRRASRRPRRFRGRSRADARWVGLAAGAALVLGILIGRLDPGPEPVAATAPASAQVPEPQLQPQHAAAIGAPGGAGFRGRSRGGSARVGRRAGPGRRGKRSARARVLRRAEDGGQQAGRRGGDSAASPESRAAPGERPLADDRRHGARRPGLRRSADRRRIVHRRQQLPDPLRADRAEPRRERATVRSRSNSPACRVARTSDRRRGS